MFFSSKLYTLSQKCTHNVLNPTFYMQNALLVSKGKHSFKITINLKSKINFEFKSELSGQLTNTTLTTDKPHLKIKLCFQLTTHSLQNPVNLFSKMNFHVKSRLWSLMTNTSLKIESAPSKIKLPDQLTHTFTIWLDDVSHILNTAEQNWKHYCHYWKIENISWRNTFFMEIMLKSYVMVKAYSNRKQFNHQKQQFGVLCPRTHRRQS